MPNIIQTTEIIGSSANNQWSLLLWLKAQPPGSFMSLFAGTGDAYEKEVLTYQTIHGMVNRYQRELAEGVENPLCASEVDLHDSMPGVQNHGAFSWLVQNGYFIVFDGYCAITQKMLAKLIGHFADKIPATPIILPSNNQNPLNGETVCHKLTA